MKLGLSVVAALFLTLSPCLSHAQDFAGAKAEPSGKVNEAPAQLRIRFPEEMVKEANAEVFNVSCSPAIQGFSGWAENNTIWTYDFKANGYNTRLQGGAKCKVELVKELKSSAGKVWAAGSISYEVAVNGPNVNSVYHSGTVDQTLRDTDPVMLIVFNGGINKERFFSEQNGYLAYLSANAPAEKIALAPLPQEQEQKVFDLMNEKLGGALSFAGRNWVLGTVKQKLVPGAKVALTVEKQSSFENKDVSSEKKFTREFTVRGDFHADVTCENPAAKEGLCLPKSPISVRLTGLAKWNDMKDAYIEYVPFKSADNRPVRSYAEIPADKKIGFWDWMLNWLANYFPYLEKYSDTVVDAAVFNVSIEPQTTATVFLPKEISDIEGRQIANAIFEFPVRIGALEEFVRMPRKLSFYEKNMQQLYMPVGVVNQNQKLLVRKSGEANGTWEPVQSFSKMIQMIRSYSARGDYREERDYTSPMAGAGVSSNVAEQTLTGQKNRPTVLQFPFGENKSGLYALEVSSPSLEESLSDEKENRFYNPRYSLAQVTDLAIHLKKGAQSNLVWVTSLSAAKPVAGAKVEIYDCKGERKLELRTDANGLASFPANAGKTENCDAPEDTGSEYFSNHSFYVGASSGQDMALIHSSWDSSDGYAFSAPGIEWFASDVRENAPNFHAILGVNLVKPGQTVPVQIVAKIPDANGFREVPAAELPVVARVVNSEDNDIFFEFPLQWKAGTASFTWQVPAESLAPLGQYYVTLKKEKGTYYVGELEVAEFKIPLMSGILSLPAGELVQPDALPVNSVIRYANGVGAKNLATDLAYYFTDASIQHQKLPGFVFGNGPVENPASEEKDSALPDEERPAMIEGLKTSAEGTLLRDLGQESLRDGRTVVDTLKAAKMPLRLVVRQRYQDQMGEFQTLSQSKVVYNAASYVGVKVAGGARDAAKLLAAVVDVKSSLVTRFDALDLKITRIETRVVGEELFGGLIRNTIEREFKPVRWAQECGLQDNVVACSVGALKEGTYAFQATDKASGQTAHSLFKIGSDGRVYSPSQYYNYGDTQEKHILPLALNKESYADGEKAVVSFASPFKSCAALVTLERSDVLSSFIVPDACERGRVEVPVRANMAPNVFVSVYALTGRVQDKNANVGEIDLGRPTYRIGFANVRVNWARFQSDVSVKTDKEVYGPGDEVKISVGVKAAQGKLDQAKVTLIAIEEKILELKENNTYDVLGALMQMRYHGVTTATLLERIETVTNTGDDMPGDARKGGEEGGDGSSKSEFRRKLFDALVFFKTDVPVVNGVAQASFKANDSLAKFKVIAVVMDSSQKFGMGSVSYLSEKDTQAYANIPTVGYTGDRFPLKVTVQNNQPKDGKFRAEITVVIRDASGKIIERKTLTKESLIGKSSSESIDVGELSVGENAASVEYVVRVYDENGKLVDSMEPAPQRIMASVPLRLQDSLLSQVENGSLTKNLVKDPDALAGQGRIQVLASKSLVAGAINAIAQRMERETFADFFLGGRFARAYLRSSEKQPDELRAVLDSLLTQVDAYGFVKYHPAAERGNVWLTAAILNVLQQEAWANSLLSSALKAKLKTGVKHVLDRTVPPAYIGKDPMAWLSAQTVMARAAFAFGDEELKEKAIAVKGEILKVVGQPDVAEKLPNSELVEIWLLEAAADAKTAAASPRLELLTGASRMVFSGNVAQLKGAPAFGFTYSDETIESAQLLQGMAKIKGDAKLAKAFALGLANANLKGWYNATTMLYVAQGLKLFGFAYEAETVTGVLSIDVPEERISGRVDFASKSAGVTGPWTHEKATVQMKHNGTGKPWVTVEALTAIPLKQARGQGLNIEKTVRNLNRDDGFQAGDVIEVTLKVFANATLRHVALLDPIPAGSNIVGEAYGEFSSGQKSYSGYKLYFEELNGWSTVKYQYQLNNPGQFQLPPTRAEGLFTPSVFGETPNSAMQVK